jgi:sugar/nucleoside kinase (ribokinase family)
LATLDVIQLVEQMPGANQKVVAQQFLLAAGGPAANAAVAAAWCGAGTTLVTALPDHPLSATVAADLETCGVTVQVGAQYQGPPVTASILVTRATGERAVVSPHSKAGDSLVATALVPTVDGVSAVLVDGHFLALALPVMVAARDSRVPVLLDAGSYKTHTDSVVRASDCVVASQDFCPPGTDGSPDAVFAYLEGLGVRYAAITRGASPVLYRTPSSTGEVPVAAVSVADTLGAGDFFHGALLAAIADHGLDDARFPEDLAQASAVAARSLASFGTRAWLREPSWLKAQ